MLRLRRGLDESADQRLEAMLCSDFLADGIRVKHSKHGEGTTFNPRVGSSTITVRFDYGVVVECPPQELTHVNQNVTGHMTADKNQPTHQKND